MKHDNLVKALHKNNMLIVNEVGSVEYKAVNKTPNGRVIAWSDNDGAVQLPTKEFFVSHNQGYLIMCESGAQKFEGHRKHNTRIYGARSIKTLIEFLKG